MSFLSCEEMLAAARSQKITLAEAVLRSDLDESRLTEEQSRAAMHHLWQVMQATSREYDPAQRSRSGLSGGDAAKVEQAHKEGKLLGGDYLSAVTAEALKTAECNACMKRIVAAPTAGSCGVLPAVLLPHREPHRRPLRPLLRRGPAAAAPPGARRSCPPWGQPALPGPARDRPGRPCRHAHRRKDRPAPRTGGLMGPLI